MSLTHGFRLVAEKDIPELASRVQLWEHEKSGGRLLSILNDDENKVFGMSFRTPPEDSTGIAHILEHSVLCGSRKYPVREPFVELLKSSLQTFLNAFTFPDKTCYPVASANEQDFHNLVDVYLDAVFHPNLTPDTLKQEGWHYEPGDDGAFEYKGVVYNEMKGAYSSPDGLLYEYSQHSVFPDTTYGLDSGGDPDAIPDLTFDQFMDFHRTHYHPSNGYAFFYGDDDPEKRLEKLDEYFSEFERTEPDTEVALQEPFTKPRVVEKTFAGGEDDKAMVTVNFLLDEAASPEASLQFDTLEHILIGLPSSPLRKALTDSGLGEDLAGAGLETELRQMYFSTGLKGIDPARANEVEELVLTTLRDMVKTGLDKQDVEAALNSVEFALRENNTGSFPRGLSIMLHALTGWLHGADPLEILPFADLVADLRKRIESGELVFENLIQEYFLANMHRTRVLLTPDQGVAAERERRERMRLDAARADMTDAEVDAVAEDAKRLHEQQQAPDDPDLLARIPRLQLDDMDPGIQTIPQEKLGGAANLHFHDLNTNGIMYMDLGLDLSAVPQDLLPLVPVFGRCLLEMGTRKRDYVDLSRLIARKTGGIWTQQWAQSGLNGQDPAQRMFIRAKSTVANASETMDILHEILTQAVFDDAGRFQRIILEAKARAEQSLVPAGHQAVARRLAARSSVAGAVNEAMSGLTGLFYLRQTARRAEEDYESVRQDLERLRKLVLSSTNMATGVTLDGESFGPLRDQVEQLAQSLPERDAATAERLLPPFPEAEGLSIPAQVNYVGKGVNVFDHGFEYTGAANVAVKYLRMDYLWEKIRVQGGAYGAFCVLDSFSGVCGLVSYRDPNLDKTLGVYDAIPEYLTGLNLSRDELEKAVIGAIGDMDAYQLPDAKGFTALSRALTGVSDDYRQRIRDEVLGTTQDDLRLFARALVALRDHGEVCVMGSRDSLQKSEAGLEIVPVL